MRYITVDDKVVTIMNKTSRRDTAYLATGVVTKIEDRIYFVKSDDTNKTLRRTIDEIYKIKD